MSRNASNRASETTPLLTYPFLKADIDEETGRAHQETLSQSGDKRANRLTSLDILRGLTMFFMIMVDNGAGYWPFTEHEWDGVSSADCVFPMFLFISGVSVVLAFRRKKFTEREVWVSVVKRAFLLVLIGIIINWSAGKFSFSQLHFPGILQRIESHGFVGICYLVVVLLYCLTPRFAARITVFVLCVIYAGIQYGLYVPDFAWTNSKGITIRETCGRGKLTPICAASSYVDRQVFGPNHMSYPQSHEGIVSTLTSIATTWAGVEAGLWLLDAIETSRRDGINIQELNQTSAFQRILKPPTWGGVILKWAVSSTLLIGISWILNIWIPLNKPIWSLSFVLWTSGLGMVLFLIFYLVLDVLVNKVGTFVQRFVYYLTLPLLWLGSNPLFVFIAMDFLDILLIRWVEVTGYNGKQMSLWAHWFHYTAASWIRDRALAAFVFALYHVILWVAVTGYMYYKKIFVTL